MTNPTSPSRQQLRRLRCCFLVNKIPTFNVETLLEYKAREYIQIIDISQELNICIGSFLRGTSRQRCRKLKMALAANLTAEQFERCAATLLSPFNIYDCGDYLQSRCVSWPVSAPAPHVLSTQIRRLPEQSPAPLATTTFLEFSRALVVGN